MPTVMANISPWARQLLPPFSILCIAPKGSGIRSRRELAGGLLLNHHNHARATLSQPAKVGNPPVSRSRHTPLPETALPGALTDGGADGSAATTPRFTDQTLKRDALAGTITGLMAIPLTVGICLMSEYPVQ